MTAHLGKLAAASWVDHILPEWLVVTILLELSPLARLRYLFRILDLAILNVRTDICNHCQPWHWFPFMHKHSLCVMPCEREVTPM